MRTEIEDWKNGWYGIRLAIDPGQIDVLIANLKMLKSDPEQHFHIKSTYKDSGGIGDIEVYMQQQSEPSNMEMLGCALLPGESIGNDPV